jgi:hypothetical protein
MFDAISILLKFYNLTNATTKLPEDGAETPKHVFDTYIFVGANK